MNSNTPHLSISRILEIDPVKARFVAKIETIIQDAKNGTAPRDIISRLNHVRKLEQIREDYIFGVIAGVGELKNAIIDLAAEVAEVL